MDKTQKIDQIKTDIDSLLKGHESSKFCIHVNKTNNFMTIQPVEDKKLNIWTEQKNDINYGPYSFIEAIGMAKVFAEYYRTQERDSFGMRITTNCPSELKLF